MSAIPRSYYLKKGDTVYNLEHVDLGITIDCALSFNMAHIQNIVSKANRMGGLAD